MTNQGMKDFNLTVEDCKLLIQAIDAWIERGLSAKMFKDIFSAVSVKSDIGEKENPELLKQELHKKFEENQRDYDKQKQESIERGRLVQAKIIILKDTLEVERLTQG